MNVLGNRALCSAGLISLLALSMPAWAQTLAATAPAPPPVPVQNYGEEALLEPRRVAANIVEAGGVAPKYVINVGSHVGEFLEVFLDRFPQARGQWTEAQENIDNHNIDKAKIRLARFGDRVNYKIGCYGRDISDGCVPHDADAIITDWMSINQNLDGIYKIYRIAAEQLPVGGWIVNLDHVAYGGSLWDRLLQTAGKTSHAGTEGPPIKFAAIRVPTVEEQLGAMRAAGFDAQVVWQSYSTVLFVGRKR